MSRFLSTTLKLGLMALIGETLLRPLLTFGGISPDFALISLVILAFAEGAYAGTLYGFVLGLIMDSAVPNLLGLHALCKTLTGFGVGRFRERMVPGMVLVEGLVVTTAALGHGLLYLLVESWSLRTPFFEPFFLEVLPSALYTGLVAVPLIRLADMLGLLRRDD